MDSLFSIISFLSASACPPMTLWGKTQKFSHESSNFPTSNNSEVFQSKKISCLSTAWTTPLSAVMSHVTISECWAYKCPAVERRRFTRSPSRFLNPVLRGVKSGTWEGIPEKLLRSEFCMKDFLASSYRRSRQSVRGARDVGRTPQRRPCLRPFLQVPWPRLWEPEW